MHNLISLNNIIRSKFRFFVFSIYRLDVTTKSWLRKPSAGHRAPEMALGYCILFIVFCCYSLKHHNSQLLPPPLPEIHRKCPNLGILPREKALLETAVHGEWDEDKQPPVFEQTERGKESLAEGLPVSSELAGLLLINVVQEHSHDDHGQHPNSWWSRRRYRLRGIGLVHRNASWDLLLVIPWNQHKYHKKHNLVRPT